MVEGSFKRKAVPPPSTQLCLEIEEGLIRGAEKSVSRDGVISISSAGVEVSRTRVSVIAMRPASSERAVV